MRIQPLLTLPVTVVLAFSCLQSARSADDPKETKPPSAEQVLKSIKESGFEVPDSPLLFEQVDAATGKILSGRYEYACTNGKTKAKLELHRNVVNLFGMKLPGNRFRIIVSHATIDCDALLAVVERISKELRKPCEESLKEYQKTKRDIQKTVGEIRIGVSKEGIQINSIPGL